MTPLCQIAQKYGTDKFSKHQYTAVYHRLFSSIRLTISCLLEIGIGTGASLRMWHDYFPNALIAGIDKSPERMINAVGIKSFVADQTDADELRRLGAILNPDVIVDDGSHIIEHQILSMKTLLPFMREHGTYVIEDILAAPSLIINKVPSGYSAEARRTAKGLDDLMLIVRRCQ